MQNLKRCTAVLACLAAGVVLAEGQTNTANTTTTTTTQGTTTQKTVGAMNDMHHDMDAAHAPMFMPHLPKMAAQDKKELDVFTKSCEQAMIQGDTATMASHVDFPVFMATDDSKNNAMGETWNHEKFMKVMGASMAHMPKDMKVTHKMHYDMLSDAMALVHDDAKMTVGGKTMSYKTASLAIRKNGEWKWKSMMEPGWGDMPMETKGTGASGNAGTGSTEPTTP